MMARSLLCATGQHSYRFLAITRLAFPVGLEQHKIFKIDAQAVLTEYSQTHFGGCLLSKTISGIPAGLQSFP
jgi:hypothetical protein